MALICVVLIFSLFYFLFILVAINGVSKRRVRLLPAPLSIHFRESRNVLNNVIVMKHVRVPHSGNFVSVLKRQVECCRHCAPCTPCTVNSKLHCARHPPPPLTKGSCFGGWELVNFLLKLGILGKGGLNGEWIVFSVF